MAQVVSPPCQSSRNRHGGETPPVRLDFQEVLQQLFSFLRQDGLGVELDAVDGEFFVREAHDFAFFGPCGDVEAIGQSFPFDDEAMIAGGFERV